MLLLGDGYIVWMGWDEKDEMLLFGVVGIGWDGDAYGV